MITIQPYFSQHRLQSNQPFGHRDRCDDFESDEFVNNNSTDLILQKESDLKDVQEGIAQTMDNLKTLENDVQLPNWAKTGISGLFTIGAAVVTGISMKFGFGKTSEYLGELAKKPAIKKASGNIKGSFSKIGKTIGKFVDTTKNTGIYKSIAEKASKLTEKFKKTSFGKKVKIFSDKIANNSLVKKTKAFFAKIKNISTNQIVDRTGDVLGTATGISTAAVGIVDPEQKAKVEG